MRTGCRREAGLSCSKPGNGVAVIPAVAQIHIQVERLLPSDDVRVEPGGRCKLVLPVVNLRDIVFQQIPRERIATLRDLFGHGARKVCLD